MAAPSTRWSAAAEHGQPAAAEPGINIAFANMDWKQERHAGKHWKDHRTLWRKTTEAMLRYFEADVLCFCEVGVVGIPVSEDHFTDLKT